MILGDPGSGKTTHLKRLLLWCLREGAAELGLAGDTLPVFLPLRELPDTSLGLEAFIEQTLASAQLGTAKGFGARLLERGRLLLLLDGLDEVADTEARAKVARWIENVASRPSCVAVVTCRFAGYGGDAQLGPEFLELHLRPLTREQSEAFIRNWYLAVETGLAQAPEQGELAARSNAEQLIERLRQPDYRAARMVEMTRNPLLLANLCLVHRDLGTLPEGRARLYEECVDVLLERWRRGKRLTVGITGEVARRVLQPVALWLHGKDQRIRASAQELAPELAGALKAVQWKGGTAEAFLRTVRDESGLLTGWGQDQYGFMHLGFQEYLAACEVRRLTFEGDAAALQELAACYGEGWWQEVILMLLALGNPSLFVPFMREVVQRPQFTRVPELLNLILEEAAEVSDAPFVELLAEPPGTDPGLWSRQRYALRVLEQVAEEATLDEAAQRLGRHPAPEIQQWLADRRSVTARLAVQETRVTANGGVELVRIPGGTFLMGSPASEAESDEDERPQHEVRVASFYMGKHPVTNAEYARFLEANPEAAEPAYWSDRRFNQGAQPVVGVSWEQAQRFAEWAGGRLPSEAEWEYAARAGTETKSTGGAMRLARTGRTAMVAAANGMPSRPRRWVLLSRTPSVCTTRRVMSGSGCRTAGMTTMKVRPSMVQRGKKLIAASA